MRDLDGDTRAHRACNAIRTAASIALCVSMGCGGGGQERSVVANEPTPTLPRPRFSATFSLPRTPTATPALAGGDSATPTPTPASLGGGTCTIPPTPPITLTPSVTPTPILPWEQQARLRIERVQAAPGSIVSVEVALVDVDEGVEIAGTQNDISLDGGQIALVENTDGKPDCTVSAEIDKEGTAFGCQPPGCAATGTCTGMRALVLSVSNVDPIPSGFRLYTCNIAVSAAAEIGATYALPCSLAMGASPAGEAIGVGCDDGAIEVVPVLTPGPTPEPDDGAG